MLGSAGSNWPWRQHINEFQASSDSLSGRHSSSSPSVEEDEIDVESAEDSKPTRLNVKTRKVSKSDDQDVVELRTSVK